MTKTCTECGSAIDEEPKDFDELTPTSEEGWEYDGPIEGVRERVFCCQRCMAVHQGWAIME